MKSILQCIVLATFLSSNLLFTGCERKVEVATRTEVEEERDDDIAELVKERLAQSEAFKFPDVHVSVYKSRVQLSGFVLTDEQKEAAETLARSVNGVVEVENKISIKK